MKNLALVAVLVFWTTPFVSTGFAEDEQVDEQKQELVEKLVEKLNGCKFVGRYTMGDKDDASLTDEYTVSSFEPTANEDEYKMVVRIKYGKKDVEAPLIMRVLFAGTTPVITLESVWVPGLGTFDSHVVIRGNAYAGTWDHDGVGGHVFGKIEKTSP
ncbi:MAG: hypothetical protein AAF664_24285 [Planctomycetota bacterium]